MDVFYFPICETCGKTHCCDPPSEIHDGSLASLRAMMDDDLTRLEGTCKGAGPWPLVVGAEYVREA